MSGTQDMHVEHTTAPSAFGPARATVNGAPLTPEQLHRLDAFWRASNYLAAGMIYLRDNPLLREPLRPEHIKERLLGHWGASPALSFVYTHLNRAIRERDLDVLFMAGPGHGAPGVLGPLYLEGTYSEVYPDKSLDEEGLRRIFKQFSFPGGIGSHCTPETPGSVHEGGELGYVLSHACGAAFDCPELIVAAVVGDAMDVIDRVPRLRAAGAHAKERLRNRQIQCRLYAHEHGIDSPEISGWRWPAARRPSGPNGGGRS